MNPTLRTADGLTLHLQHWPLEDARGTVLIVHGLGEHIGRCAHVAAALNAARWRVVGYDQRGHGRSTGDRGRLTNGDDLLADVARVIDAVRAQRAGPLVLLGHSMGGLVAARFAAEALAAAPASWSRPLDALVLSSPALNLGMTPVQTLLLAVLGWVAPDLAIGNGLKPQWVSNDPAVVEAYAADPLVHDRVTARLVRFMVEAGAMVLSQAARWQLPTLLLYAGADRCVSPAGSAAFSTAAPVNVVTTQRFAHFAHEIFNEPEKDQVLAALTAWLAALPAGA